MRLPRSHRARRLLTETSSQLAPKTKGITSMSVKEVLQSLVDDSVSFPGPSNKSATSLRTPSSSSPSLQSY